MKRLAIAVALGTMVLGTAPVVGNAGPALADGMTSNTSVSAVSETANADGTVTDTWSVAGQPVSVTGPRGMVVTADLTFVNGQHVLSVGSTPPPLAKPNKGTGPSLASYTYRSWCNTLQPQNGYGRGCDWQQVIQQNGADWYLSDSETYSAHYGCGFWCPSLRAMNNYTTWSANNQEVQWSPGSSTAVGQCQQTTVGVAYIASISETFTECPQQFGLFTLSSTQFGVYWWGQSQTWEAADGVDVVHSPPGACSCTTLHTSMNWS